MTVLSMLGEVVLHKSSKTSKRSKREAYLMLKEDRLIILWFPKLLKNNLFIFLKSRERQFVSTEGIYYVGRKNDVFFNPIVIFMIIFLYNVDYNNLL